MATWVPSVNIAFSSLGRTLTPTTAGAELSTSGLYDITGDWFTQGGGVESVAASGGSWSVAPNIVFTPTYDGSSHTVAPAGTVTLSAGALSGVTMTNMGRGIASCTVALSGGTGSGGSLGSPVLNSNVASNINATSSPYFLLGVGALVSPTLITTNARATVTGRCTFSLDAIAAVTNWNSASGYGLAVLANTNGMYIYLIEPTDGGSLHALAYTSGSWVAGHQYSVDIQTIFTTGEAVVTGTVTDLTTSTVIATYAYTLLQSALTQAAWNAVNQPGQAGTMPFGASTCAIDSVEVYNYQQILCSPVAAPINDAGGYTMNLTLSGGYDWSGGTTISLSGVAGVALTSQNITGNNTATIVFTTGSTTGTVTVGDGTTTGTFTVELAQAPNLSIVSQGAQTNTIAASGPAIAVVPPYSYSLYSSPYSGQTPGASRLVSVQSGLTLNQTPENVVDTGASPGTTAYQNTITDSGTPPQTIVDDAILCVSYSNRAINWLTIGDSETQGFDPTNPNVLTQEVISVTANGYGSGLTAPFNFSFSGGAGSGATIGGYSIVGGELLYLWPTPGFGYTAAGGAPVLNATAGAGTFPAFTVNIGGGWVSVLQSALRNNYGYPYVNLWNAAIGGTNTSQWLPGSPFLSQALAKAAFYGCTGAFIAFGTNDISLAGLSIAQFQANMVEIITAVIAAGMSQIILIAPLWANPLASGLSRYTPTVLYNLQLIYSQVIPALVAQFPGSVVAGPEMFSITLGNPSLLAADGLHLNDGGKGLVATAIESIAAVAMGLTPGQSNFANGSLIFA